MNEPTLQKTLRLWPGVVAVVLQWLGIFVVANVVPEAAVFGVVGGLFGVLAIVVWWALFSRAPRSERWGAIVLMIVALVATPRILHESVATGNMGFQFFIYAIPVLSLAFVVWAAAGRRLSDGPRRAAMVATILLACGVFTLVRSKGITGDGAAEFAWRWAETAEERLLAKAPDVMPDLIQEPAALPVWSKYSYGQQVKRFDWPASSAPAAENVPREGMLVVLDRGRKLASAVWRHVEQVPERPHYVHVMRMAVFHRVADELRAPGVEDALGRLAEDVHHRHQCRVARPFAYEIVENVAPFGGGVQRDRGPSTQLRPVAELLWAGGADDGHGAVLRHGVVVRVEGVDQRRTGRAGCIPIGTEHHAVEQERAMLTEELFEGDLVYFAVGADAFEPVVFLEPPAQGQLAAPLGHRFDLGAKVLFQLEQLVAAGTVVVGFVRKAVSSHVWASAGTITGVPEPNKLSCKRPRSRFQSYSRAAKAIF